MVQVQVSLFSSWCLEYLTSFCSSFLSSSCLVSFWRYYSYYYYPPVLFLSAASNVRTDEFELIYEPCPCNTLYLAGLL